MDSFANLMKKNFEGAHPNWATMLKNAQAGNNQNEVLKVERQIKHSIIKEINEKTKHLNHKNIYPKDSEDSDNSGDGYTGIALNLATANKILNARGNEIKVQLQALLSSQERLSKMKKRPVREVGATMWGAGIVAFGTVGAKAFSDHLAQNPSTRDPAVIIPAVIPAAILAGVVAVGGPVVVAAIALFALISVIIPLIYYMIKPAHCVGFLINRLRTRIGFDSQYNIHGRPLMRTPTIPGEIAFDGHLFIYGGFIAAKKFDFALVGCHYGFVYHKEDEAGEAIKEEPTFSFGMYCPLSNLLVNNSCHTDFDLSAHYVADMSKQINTLESVSTNETTQLTIRCSSGTDAIPYYAACITPL